MSAPVFYTKPRTSAERLEFYERLRNKSMAPLWEVLGELITHEPQPSSFAALWHYDELRPLLMESGQLISAKEAERRVLILENPGLPGRSQITQSLYAGLQLVLPGEVTPSHRHAASALRFVIEGEGAYTTVAGARTMMHPGDLILTPSWTVHDHDNPSGQPVVWLDGLDIPIVNVFDASFAEHDVDEMESYGHPEGGPSPQVFHHPYASSREKLARLSREGPVHPCHGVKMRYENPATGGYPMPAIGAFLQLLPSGFQGAAYRSTDATIYFVVEGSGSSQVGANSLEWAARDIFVAPSWCPLSHTAAQETVLFSFSDRPVQETLGLWRERTEGLNTGTGQ